MSTVAKDIAASLDLADALEAIVQMQSDVDAQRTWIDVAKSDVHSLLTATGRKSVTIGNLSARIVPVNIVHCLCHQANATVCPNVLAGIDVAVKLVQSERLVVKKRTEIAESA